jgi:hypothetical protein
VQIYYFLRKNEQSIYFLNKHSFTRAYNSSYASRLLTRSNLAHCHAELLFFAKQSISIVPKIKQPKLVELKSYGDLADWKEEAFSRYVSRSLSVHWLLESRTTFNPVSRANLLSSKSPLPLLVPALYPISCNCNPATCLHALDSYRSPLRFASLLASFARYRVQILVFSRSQTFMFVDSILHIDELILDNRVTE